MQRYLKLTNQLASNFDRVEFAQVPRNQNTKADEVARNASADKGKDDQLKTGRTKLS